MARLEEGGMAGDPLTQFDCWFKEAAAHPGIVEPNSMALATADAEGRPAVRHVLLKVSAQP